MPMMNVEGVDVQVDDEGFMTNPSDWSRAIGEVLASNIGIDMTDEHWVIVEFLRADHAVTGETATTRRVDTVGGFPTKTQFTLFPKKPAKKMAYIAGLPKPHGCV